MMWFIIVNIKIAFLFFTINTMLQGKNLKMPTTKYLTSSEINLLPSKPADIRINYGKNEMQFIDLRLPKGKGPFPILAIMHGGCWISKYASLQNTSAMADALRDKGFATANIEYRCIDEGGGWPGTFLDIGTAINKLLISAKEHSLDKERVITIGHSAGGHLAFWAAGRHRIPKDSAIYMEKPTPILGTISLGGAADLEASFDHFENLCGKNTMTAMFQGSPQTAPNHYKAGSPIRLLPMGVFQILITGAGDQAVPAIFAENYVKKATQEGDQGLVESIIVPNCGHHEYNHPGTHAFEVLLNSVNKIISWKK